MVKRVFDKWLSYDNPELDIIHKTAEHHTR